MTVGGWVWLATARVVVMSIMSFSAGSMSMAGGVDGASFAAAAASDQIVFCKVV